VIEGSEQVEPVKGHRKSVVTDFLFLIDFDEDLARITLEPR
jgi:hypothetical protein